MLENVFLSVEAGIWKTCWRCMR